MTVIAIPQTKLVPSVYKGLSTDVKPTPSSADIVGSLFYETNKGRIYFWDGANWRLDLSGKGTLQDTDLLISQGFVQGHTIMSGMGEREGMGTTAAGEDVWRGSAASMPVPVDAGEQMTVTSSSANDDVGNTGATEITIEYLDANGDEQTTTVAMNGTADVDVTPTNVRFVNDMYTSAVGSNGVAVGDITIFEKATPANIYNMIYQGGNKSLVPHRMVPNGKTLHLKSWNCSETSNKDTIVRIRSDCTPAGVRQQGIYLFKGTFFVNTFSSPNDIVNRKIPELSVLKVSAWSTAAGADVSVNWWGILSDN